MSDRAHDTGDFLLLGLPLVGLLCSLSAAGPDDPVVVRGSASFQRAGDLTTIRVSDNAIINYRQFNIAAPETVRFIQPGSDARVLNRITGASPTRIEGTLLANGQVFLVNPAGVLFGKNSVVNVGSLIAAAGHLSDQEFLSGTPRITGLSGPVVNEGVIRGGRVVLAGQSVVNLGSIVSPEGLVAMVAGDEVYLGKAGGKMYAKVSGGGGPGEAGGVRNEGKIDASGGRAVLAAGDMFSLALGSGSSIKASSVQARAGGQVTVRGTIDASSDAPGGVGGDVEITGRRVGVLGATVDASGPAGGGEVLIGGDAMGAGDTPTASAVFVDSASGVRADAERAGDGGRVVVFAEDSARVHGALSARGGREGGDGGMIETSGKRFLEVSTVPDAGAPAGQGGWWVLDPFNVNIINDTAGNGSLDGLTPNFVAGGNNSTISNAQIDLALDAGTSVLVSTNDGVTGSQAGNIAQDSDAPITKSAGGNATIEFRSRDGNGDGSGGLITLSGGFVNTSGNELNVVLKADAAELGGSLVSGVVIDTNAMSLGSGDLTVNGASVQISADITGGDLVFNAPVTIGGGGTRTITGTGSVDFTSTLAGGSQSLTVDSPDTTFGGAVTGVTTLTTDAPGTTKLGDDVSAGTVVFNDAVELDADVTVTGTTSVTFGSTVNSDSGNNRDLTLAGSGTVSFDGKVGQTDALDQLVVDSSGLTTTIRDDVTAVNLDFKGDVTIDDGSAVDGDGVTLTGTGTVGSRSIFLREDLTTTGSGAADGVELVGNATGSTRVEIGDGDADVLTLGGPMTVTGGTIYVRNVTGAGQDLTLDTSGNGGTTWLRNNVTNVGTLTTNANDTLTIGLNRTISGTTLDFQDAAVNLLGHLDCDTASFDGSVVVAGTTVQVTATTGVTFGDATTDVLTMLSALQVLDGTGDATFNKITGNNKNLSVDASGLTRFLAAATGLGTLTVEDTTTGTGTTTINTGTFSGAALDFEDPVTLGQTLIATGTTSVTFGSTLAGGGFDLTVNSPSTSFGGAVSNIVNLTTDAPGTTAVNGGITATGALVFNDAVTLSSNVTGASAAFGGTLTVAGGNRSVTANGGGAASFAGIAADGSNRTLTINTTGTTTLGGTISDGQLSLTTNSGGTTAITGAISNSGALTFNDPVALSANTSGASATFGGTLTVTGGDRTVTTSGNSSFAGIAADGSARTLTVNSTGTTTFGSAINDAQLSLTTSALGSTHINADISGAALAFNDAVVLGGGNRILTGSTSVAFGSTLNGGGFDLTVNSPSTSFGGAVSNIVNLTTDAPGTTAVNGGIAATGVLTFNDPVTLSSNVSGASVSFGGALTIAGGNRTVTTTGASAFAGIGADGSARTLTVNSGGATTLGGTINDSDLSLTTDAAGTTAINSAILDSDSLTFNDPVTLSANVSGATAAFGGTLTVTGGDRTVATGGDATFAGIAADGSNRLLTVNSPGTTTFGGTINDAQLSLTTDAPGVTVISGTITDSGTLTFNDPVALSANVSGGTATFGGTLTVTGGNRTVTTSGDSTYAGIATDGSARTLALNSAGTTTLGAAISDSLLRLTTGAAGSTRINADISGASFAFNDAVTIGGTGVRAVEASGASGVVFNSTVTLGASPVTGLRVRANEIDLGGSVSPGGAGQTLALEPATVDMVLNGTPAGGQLDLTQGELDQIQSGFAGVTLGRVDSTSDVRVASGGVEFNGFDATLTAGPGRSVVVGGTLDTKGNTLAVVLGSGGTLQLGGSIVSGGAGVDLTGAPVATLIADSTIDSDGGAITFSPSGTLDGGFDLSLLAEAGGAVVAPRIGTTTAVADLTIRGGSVTLPQIGASGSAGASGTVTVDATARVTFSGTTYETNGATYSAPSFAVNGTAGQTTTFATHGGALTFAASGGDGAITLAEDVDLSLDAGAAVTVHGPIDGTAGGQAEHVTANAGGAVAEFRGAIGGTVPVGSLTSTGSTTRLGGAVTTAAGGDVSIAGNLQVREGTALAITTGAGGDIGVSGDIFGAQGGGAETLTLNPGGSITVGGGVFGRDTLVSSATGLTTLVANGPISLGGNVGISGGLTFGDTAALSGATVLEAGELDFTGGAGSVGGAGALTLIPSDAAAAINVGSAAGAGSGSLDLSAADLAALADGFASITIGRANGAHAVTIGNAAFRDDLFVRSPSGSIAVSGRLTSAGGAGVTLRQSGTQTTFLAGADVGITTSNGTITVQGPLALASGASPSFVSGGGAVSLADTGGIDGAGSLTVSAGAGAVTIGSSVGSSTPLASLAVTGGAVTLPAAITTSGDQTYSGTVAGRGAYTSSAGAMRFDGQLDLPADLALSAANGLTVNAAVDDASGQSAASQRSNLSVSDSGAVVFAGEVGGTTPIGTLDVRDSASLTAQGAVRAENIVTRNIAGQVVFGEIVTDGTPGAGGFGVDLVAGSFDLDGPFTTSGLKIDVTSDAGLASLGNLPQTWDGFTGDLVQSGDSGVVRLNTDVAQSDGSALPGDVTLNGVLELSGATRRLAAENVSLLGGFRASSGNAGVTVLTLSPGSAGRAVVRGLAGSLDGAGLDSLIGTLVVDGRSTLGGQIGTQRGMDFHGEVRIGQSSGDEASLRVNGAGGMLFRDNIVAGASGVALSLQNDPAQAADVTTEFATNADGFLDDITFPVIEFRGDVGSSGSRLGSLTLNGEGHTTVPALPSIISRDGVSFFVSGDFTMGVGEKMTVLGDLAINSGGTIRLSDLSVAGDLRLNGAQEIVLQNRAGGDLIGYGKGTNTRGVGTDDAGDIVLLGQTIIDNGASVRVERGDASTIFSLASPDGGGLGSLAVNGTVLRQFGTADQILTEEDFRVVAGEVPDVPPGTENLLLDLRADGPVVQDVTSALAGAIPRNPETGEVTRGTRLSAAQLEQLLRLGINAVQDGGTALSPGGPRVYNNAGAVTEMHQISVNRMSADAVDIVLGRFNRLFYRGEGDARVFSPDTLKFEIEQAVLPYFDQGEDVAFEPAKIWDYLVHGSPEQVKAASDLYEVKLLTADLDRMGLTRAEAAVPRRNILGFLQSQQVFASSDEVASLVAAAEPVGPAEGPPASAGLDGSSVEAEPQP